MSACSHPSDEICSGEVLAPITDASQEFEARYFPESERSLASSDPSTSDRLSALARVRISDEDSVAWREWSERHLKETQLWIDGVEKLDQPGRVKVGLRIELHQLANDFVLLNGYATQQDATRMKKTLRVIRERAERVSGRYLSSICGAL